MTSDSLLAASVLPLSLEGGRRFVVERAASESVSRKEAARILGCSEKTVWKWMRRYRVTANWSRM